MQLAISNSSRKKEYINTSPAEECVGLTKSLAELEELKPDSKDVTYKSNIDRYTMRPKKLEMWSLSDYVAKLDIVYPKKMDQSHKERNDIFDINELEDQDESVSYCDEGDFPLCMRNGIMLRRRSKNKVIRFRNYRQKDDPENYCRGRLMLYIPWKKEKDILGNFGSYEEAFRAEYEKIERENERI